jgi:hypothetical protein
MLCDNITALYNYSYFRRVAGYYYPATQSSTYNIKDSCFFTHFLKRQPQIKPYDNSSAHV